MLLPLAVWAESKRFPFFAGAAVQMGAAGSAWVIKMHHLKYRTDIDGLRAVAILSVVLFHAIPELVPGGFVGVDVFFVISGFLITGNIIKDFVYDEFSFSSFYSHRVCRLFPSLILVMIFSVLIGWCYLLPDEFKSLGKHLRGGAFYISNFVLRSELGYFDVQADKKPFLHLWSLAIEEQYYIVWPVILLILRRFSQVNWKWPSALMLLSLGWSLVYIQHKPGATFFLPETRVWELLLGSILALGFPQMNERLELVLSQKSGVRFFSLCQAGLGLLAILASVFFFRSTMLYPSWRALIPTLGAMLLISAKNNNPLNEVFLSNNFAVFIGKISYPLYLWHWPLLAFVRIRSDGGKIDFYTRVELVILAFVLAYATYRFVEQPFRSSQLSLKRKSVGLVVGCGFMAFCGQVMMSGWVLPFTARAGIDDIMAASGEWDYPNGMAEQTLPNGHILRWLPTMGGNESVLFVGDSNVEQYAPRLKQLIKEDPSNQRSVLFLTLGGCPPISGLREDLHPLCGSLADTAVAVARERKVSSVVLGAQWFSYFVSDTYRVNEGLLAEEKGREAAMSALEKTIRQLRDDGTKVYLILSIPIGGELDPKNQVKLGFLSYEKLTNNGITKKALMDKYGSVDAILRSAAEIAGAKVLDPKDFLCRADGVCPANAEDGMPIYKDSVHLRPTYVRSRIHFLDDITKR